MVRLRGSIRDKLFVEGFQILKISILKEMQKEIISLKCSLFLRNVRKIPIVGKHPKKLNCIKTAIIAISLLGNTRSASEKAPICREGISLRWIPVAVVPVTHHSAKRPQFEIIIIIH